MKVSKQDNVCLLTPGYVQTPDWSKNTTYPNNMDSWARLTMPANNSVMVSFRYLDIEGSYYDSCEYDSLTVYARDDDTSSNTVELVLCNDKRVPKPLVFHTSLLTFHFVSDSNVEYTGFKMLFTFHHESVLPEKTGDGTWNCSVEHWPHFQLHLNCNLVEECYAAEDESNCTDLVGSCGRGQFHIGGSCYSFVEEDRQVTWNEAAYECSRRDAYLASLNNHQEWDDVMSIISDLTEDPVYFGLLASGSSFPEL